MGDGLSESIPREMLCETWEKIIDPCVFGKNGLRMLWNRKASTCKVCKGVPYQTYVTEKRKRMQGTRGPASSDVAVRRPDVRPCKICNTFDNRVDEGRPYEIVAVTDCNDPAREMMRLADPMFAMESASIRIVSSSPPVVVRDLCLSKQMRATIDPYAKKYIYDINAMRAPAKKEYAIRRTIGSDGTRASSFVPVYPDDDAYPIISGYVMEFMGCGIVSIKANGDRRLFLTTTNSHSCKNKGSDHNRSTVYHVFYPDGHVQKCWCRKEDVYRAGGVPCSLYRSPLIPYDPTWAERIRGLFGSEYARQFPFTMSPPEQIIGADPNRPSPWQRVAMDDIVPANIGRSSAPLPPASQPSLQVVAAECAREFNVDRYADLRGMDFETRLRTINEKTRAWVALRTTIPPDEPSSVAPPPAKREKKKRTTAKGTRDETK
jgi:hypothetical protein